MKDKFIRKYMRIAKLIGEDDNPCYSRQIGVVIVDPQSNTIRGTGYNGPPPGTPHTDTPEYLRHYFFPQLTQDDIEILNGQLDYPSQPSDFTAIRNENICNAFIEKFAGKNICPRRLINAKSGERNELCSCGHAERHAITNAACNIHGMIMLCWCGVPCLQCSDAIIQAGIKTVHCLLAPLYHNRSLWLLESGGVELIQHRPEKFD